MIFMDGECVYRTDDINLPFNGKNNSEIKRMCRAIVDKELAEDGRTECTDMALVRR
jgi:glutamate racemase